MITPKGGTNNGLPGGTVTGTAPGLAVYDATLDPGGTSQDDAFDYGMELWVNNQIYAPTSVTSYTDQLNFGAVTLSGLDVYTEFYLAPHNNGTLRAVVTLQNKGGSPVSVPVYWASNLGSDANTTLYTDSSGNNDFTTDDSWLITNDGPTHHDPIVTHVLGGPGAPAVTPSSVVTNVFSVGAYPGSARGVGATYSVTVPAGTYRNLMFFEQLNVTNTVAAARAAADFDVNPGPNSPLVSGQPHLGLLKTVNWAFTNVTPVANDDSGVAFTNGGPRPMFVTDNDTDADNDTLHVTAVSAPAHGTASIGSNQYGARYVVYTPTADYAGPDSFTYTISDGLGGTAIGLVSVSVGGPASVTLPWTLVAGPNNSSQWLAANYGGTSNGLPLNGSCENHGALNINDVLVQADPLIGYRYRAFDYGLLVWAANQVITSTGQVTVTARGLDVAPMNTAGLRASISYYGMPESNTLRTLASFYNPLGGTLNATITLESNLGTDSATGVRRTSSGDSTFNAGDRWVVTSDDPVSADHAVVTHVLYGPGPVPVPVNSVSLAVFDCYGTEGVRATYSLSVPPGETRRLMFFTQVYDTNDAAINAAAAFNGPLTPSLLAGLSPAERAEIRNWVMPSVEFLPTLSR